MRLHSDSPSTFRIMISVTTTSGVDPTTSSIAAAPSPAKLTLWPAPLKKTRASSRV